MPLVLMLALVSGILLAAAYERQATQRRVVQRQLFEYRRHHEVFGIRAILAKWKQPLDLAALEELATLEGSREEELAMGFNLPSGARVRVYVRDGQGAALATPESLPPEVEEAYEGMLDRLPQEAGNRRVHGPWQISVNSAPRAVLEALSPREGEELADRILRERRRRGEMVRGEMEPLVRLSITREVEREAILQILTTNPTIWMLDIRVFDEQGERRFGMLLQGQQAGAAGRGPLSTLQWFEVPVEEDVSQQEQGGQDGRREGGSERSG